MLLLIVDSLAKEIAFLQNAEGSGLAPFDCWLCLRGIKTMALRVEKQQVKLRCNLYTITYIDLLLASIQSISFSRFSDIISFREESNDWFVVVRLMPRRLLNS